MRNGEISRRRLFGVAALTAAAAATTVLPTEAAQAAPTGSRTWRGRRSANGWPVLDEAGWHDVEGSGRRVRLAGGDAAVILTYVARRFHYEIDQLRDGDLHGHTTARTVRQEYESNHLSGSALAIRPDAYPAGATDGFYPAELVVVRDILAELGGVVAWGGDFDVPKESHFEIAYRPGDPRVTRAAARIRDDSAEGGAGSVDAFDPARRVRAAAFARRGR